MKTVEEVLLSNGYVMEDWMPGYTGEPKAETGEFRLVVTAKTGEGLSFYLHPINRNGDTINGIIKGNEIKITSCTS